MNLFEAKKLAYFAIDPTNYGVKTKEVEIYPILKKYQFYKVFDTYEAFQKIEHFLTNELIKPDDMKVVIPDNLKAQSKGFDKWSFRKEPTTRKK